MRRVQIVVAIVVDNDWDKDYDNDESPADEYGRRVVPDQGKSQWKSAESLVHDHDKVMGERRQ